MHGHSSMRGLSDAENLTEESPALSRFVNPMNLSTLSDKMRTAWLCKSVLSDKIQRSAVDVAKDMDIEDSNQSLSH